MRTARLVAALSLLAVLCSGFAPVGQESADYARQDRQFSRLDRRASRVLRPGQRIDDVRRRFGAPRAHDPSRVLAWNDVRYGNAVVRWTYAVNVSGTTAWEIVFVNGCMDRFGAAQQSAVFYRYGRPGWSVGSDPHVPYRFDGPGANACLP